MNIHYMTDQKGQTVAVQIPIDEWEAIRALAEQAEELDEAMARLHDPDTQWVDHDLVRESVQ